MQRALLAKFPLKPEGLPPHIVAGFVAALREEYVHQEGDKEHAPVGDWMDSLGEMDDSVMDVLGEVEDKVRKVVEPFGKTRKERKSLNPEVKKAMEEKMEGKINELETEWTSPTAAPGL